MAGLHTGDTRHIHSLAWSSSRRDTGRGRQQFEMDGVDSGQNVMKGFCYAGDESFGSVSLRV